MDELILVPNVKADPQLIQGIGEFWIDVRWLDSINKNDDISHNSAIHGRVILYELT